VKSPQKGAALNLPQGIRELGPKKKTWSKEVLIERDWAGGGKLRVIPGVWETGGYLKKDGGEGRNPN